MSMRDVDTAEGTVRLWNKGDRAGFLAAFHPDGQWSSAIKRQVEGGEGVYRGHEEIGRFWDEWHSVWDHLSIVFSDARSPRDGWVVAFGRFRATGTGSGVGLDRPFAWVFQVEDGLIRDACTYLSREEALEAAGLSE